MSKKMTFRKKGLAVILSLMMAAAALSGCGKETEEPQTEVEEDDDSLEVPEIKGKEDTIGVFTLLVPKGGEAEEGDSESSIVLEDEDGNHLYFTVVEKDDAKQFIEDFKEGEEKAKDVEFTIEGVKWTGASYKTTFAVYGKVNKKIILVTSDGFKYDDDIPVAVLASLSVDSDAEPVSVSGGGNTAVGGVFTYGDGLYSVEYGSGLREADPASEFGDLVSADGKQIIYVTSLSGWDFVDEKIADIQYYDPKVETISVGYLTGYLYTYEDFWGDISAEFIVPLDVTYRNNWGEMQAVYIYTTGSSYDDAVTEDFRELLNTLTINVEYMTTEVPNTSTGNGTTDFSSYAEWWERGWYGFWIVCDACDDYADNIGYAYDCLATFTFEGDDQVHFELVDSEGDTDVDCYMQFLEDSTDIGWLMSESGDVIGFDVEDTYFYIDPEADGQLLPDYISADIWLYGDDGTWAEIKLFLRAWGSDFDDFYDVSESDLPSMCVNWETGYADMYPFNYDSWYVNVMNDPFPGINAIVGTNN